MGQGGIWDERDIGNYGTVREMAGGDGRRVSDKERSLWAGCTAGDRPFWY
jgi:hypothetical protein